MKRSLPPGVDPKKQGRRFAGPRVVLAGFIIILLITGFVVTRIVQTSGPGPEPETIPDRPGRTSNP